MHTHTPVPQAHGDTERLARASTASLVGPQPNALLRHMKLDDQEGETWMLDSASHLGALDHGVGRRTLPGLGRLLQAPGGVLAPEFPNVTSSSSEDPPRGHACRLEDVHSSLCLSRTFGVLVVGIWGSYMQISICTRDKSLQSCLTLCDPMDCSPPGSSIHEILQARILE